MGSKAPPYAEKLMLCTHLTDSNKKTLEFEFEIDCSITGWKFKTNTK